MAKLQYPKSISQKASTLKLTESGILMFILKYRIREDWILLGIFSPLEANGFINFALAKYDLPFPLDNPTE